MDQHPHKVIHTHLALRERLAWVPTQKHMDKRLLRNTAFFAAVSLCVGAFAWLSGSPSHQAQAVMSHLSTEFEYDETLGKLQLVSNILPESALVFLNTAASEPEFHIPVQAASSHEWTQQEPWLEYTCIGDVFACQEGEVAAVIKNHAGTYTARILHDGGYESIYSGLHAIHMNENDMVSSGQIIGTSAGKAAFELRKDGISILPSFSDI